MGQYLLMIMSKFENNTPDPYPCNLLDTYICTHIYTHYMHFIKYNIDKSIQNIN